MASSVKFANSVGGGVEMESKIIHELKKLSRISISFQFFYIYNCITSSSSCTCTVRKFNWWRCLARCDDIFDHFTLFAIAPSVTYSEICQNFSNSVGGFSSCVVSKLHMLRIPGLILAAHTIVGTGGRVLQPCYLGDKDMEWLEESIASLLC